MTTSAFRRATPADAALVRDLTRAAYAKWVPLIGREPLPMTVDYAVAVVAHRIDLLVADEAVVGLIELVFRPDDLLIENVAVSPSHQGRGHGRTLMARAEAVASESGRPAIRLYTNALFAENVQLYRGLGYRIEREEPFRGGTIVQMLKTPAG